MLWDRDEQTALGVYALLALVREFLPAMLVRGDGAILSAQGASAMQGRPNIAGGQQQIRMSCFSRRSGTPATRVRPNPLARQRDKGRECRLLAAYLDEPPHTLAYLFAP